MLLFSAPKDVSQMGPVDEAISRLTGGLDEVRTAFASANGHGPGQEVGLVLATAQLDVAVLRAQMAAAIATNPAGVAAAVGSIADVARRWLRDDAVQERIARISSAEHAHSVVLRVEGAAAEAERAAAAIAARDPDELVAAQQMALQLARNARLALTDVASSVRHSG